MKWRMNMILKGRKLMYLAIPLVVGAAITLQGVFSNKIGEQSGIIQMVILMHLFGLIAGIIVYLIGGNTSITFIKEINFLPIIAGSLGVIIVSGFAKSISLNGMLTTIMISVMIQMIFSKIIDHFGLFGVTKNPVNIMQIVSIVFMISAVVLFQKSK